MRCSSSIPRLLCLSLLAVGSRGQDFATFESPPGHSVAISPDRTRLFVVNTVDHRLAVFDLRDPRRPALLGEVPVGHDPVAVAARDDDEVWVVDQLSDAVSVVDVHALEVVATLACRDEPSDIVFAGGRAFVSCSTTREVLAFDAASRQLVGAVAVFADEPRALAAASGRVYVASSRSGNGTTILAADLAPPQPAPTNAALPPPPQVGRIVDQADPTWQRHLPWNLPDEDVFEIDAGSLQVTRTFAGIGTGLFGLCVEPGSGAIWASHTDARNLVRFTPALRGHVVDHRLTRIGLDPGGGVAVHELNPGIDYSVLPNPVARSRALAQPAGVVWAPDGSELYVAAFGSDRLAVLAPTGAILARLEFGATTPQTVDPRGKRGPSGLVHHGVEPLLYVHHRLANSLAVIDTAARTELCELPLFDPTPAIVRQGRGFLYDTRLSGNGTLSCASCHVDGRHDGLAWDLGEPGGQLETVLTEAGAAAVHPMKGPMLTQTLQGLPGTEPLHWRGDHATFDEFNELFDTLLGGAMLPAGDMAALERFVAAFRYPPNPFQGRDRSLPDTPAGESALEGFTFFTTESFTTSGAPRFCVDCHVLPAGTDGGVRSGGLLGTSQPFDVPSLRGIYKRIPARRTDGASTAGFGVVHDGSRVDVVDLHNRTASHQYDGSEKLQAFVQHFDTGTAPIVGTTLQLDAASRAGPVAASTWNLLEQRAGRGECELVARGRLDGEPFAWLFRPASSCYEPSRAGATALRRDQLDELIAVGRARVVLMAVLPGAGLRVALDRDRDGVRDGDERPQRYGGAGGRVTLRANSAPETGNALFGFVAEGAPPAAAGLLLLGPQAADVAMAGVRVLVAPATAAVRPLAADVHGVAVAPTPIPADPSLRGLTVYAQALFAAPTAAPVTASAGLRVAVQ